MLYEVYLNGKHMLNICCTEGELIGYLKHMSFLNAAVRIHNTFYNSWYVWTEAQTLLSIVDRAHALQSVFSHA